MPSSETSVPGIINELKKSIHTAIVGKDEVLDLLLIAMLCEGHVLIEDVPGVGKTSFVQALASATGCSFRRIQFTPDIMPADITGFSMPDIKSGDFRYRPGMLMSQMVLADEINRATAKTQSALLEAMEERQISVDGETYALPRPFMVLATQNPNENIGTYPLPESQIDRFLIKISIGYPAPAEELEILNRYVGKDPRSDVRKIITAETVIKLQQYTARIFASDLVKEYIIQIVNVTRTAKELAYGISPRGSLALLKAAQANAVLCERQYVTPKDVRAVAVAVLSHRLVLTPEALTGPKSPDALVHEYVSCVPVPVGGKSL